jgi:dolichol-phosphate mannosyltransferase
MSVWIILPAYNEEDSIPRLFPKIDQAMREHQVDYRIVLCNDGSKDATLERAREFATLLPIDILNHRINRGLGETIRDLMEYAAECASPDDIIVRLDCDDTHDPSIIIKMMEKIKEGYEVVIASRFAEGGGQMGVEGNRAFLTFMARQFMRTFFPLGGIKEYTSGFRAYKASLIQSAIALYGNQFIQLKGFGFACTLEKLVKLHLMNARMTEVGFVLRYDQKASPSKMIASITTYGYLVMTVMYYWPWGGWRQQYKKRVAEMGR